MARPSQRRAAILSLKKAIEASVSDLEDRVIPWSPKAPGSFPYLEIMPPAWRYYPDQATTLSLSNGVMARNVGRHEGIVQLRLTAQSPDLRTPLEDDILNLFLDTEGHPGAIITQVSTIPDMPPFVVSWDLDEETWAEAFAQNDDFTSTLAVVAQLPAIALRRGVRHTDTRIRLGGDLGDGVETRPI